MKKQQQPTNGSVNEPLMEKVPTGVTQHPKILRENDGRVAQEKNDTSCGIFGFYPACLQRFSTIKAFYVLLLFTVLSFSFGMSVSIVSITNLQKRYGLSSRFIGVYNLLKDGMDIVAVVIVTYFGGRPNSHRPRWVAAGLFLCAVGFSLKTITQFISPLYDYEQLRFEKGDRGSSELCSIGNSNSSNSFSDDARCEHADTQGSIIPIGSEAVILLLISSIIIGLGNTPIFILGISHIDDNVSKKKSPLYMGVFFAVFGIGPVIGMPMASYFTNMYVDFYRVEEVDIDPSDPRWVGAWWLGYFVIATMMLVISCLMLLVPKRPPDKLGGIKRRPLKVEKASHCTKLKDYSRTLLRLFCNMTLICTILARTATFATHGGAMFYGKYLEEQFRLTTAVSGMLMAACIIVPACFGFLITGTLLRRWNPTLINMAKLVVALDIVVTFLPVLLMKVGCEPEQFAGVTIPYPRGPFSTPGDTSINQVKNACNSQCACSANYDPVCASDKRTYYSPCYAGCAQASGNRTFTECRCALGDNGWDNDTLIVEGVAHSGMCGEPCQNKLIMFITINVVIGLAMSASMTIEMMIMLRCVLPEDKSFALGLRSVMTQVLGSVPGPIVAGMLIDSACALWGTTVCHEKGACLLYDLPNYRVKLQSFFLFLKTLSLFFFILVWISLCRNPDAGNTDNEDAPVGIVRADKLTKDEKAPIEFQLITSL